jgi:hypothetical protein
MQDEFGRHRVEAAGSSVPIRPVEDLAEDQEPGEPCSDAASRGWRVLTC